MNLKKYIFLNYNFASNHAFSVYFKKPKRSKNQEDKEKIISGIGVK